MTTPPAQARSASGSTTRAVADRPCVSPHAGEARSTNDGREARPTTDDGRDVRPAGIKRCLAGGARSSRRQRVIVVGGGIAGIAAAVRLADRGVAVTLLETRRKLGGRATSFDDVRTGEKLDNCQHIVMGCCTNFLELLRRLGVADRIAWSRSITWIEPGGRRSVIRPGWAPAPMHMARSFLTARFLTIEEKFAIARAMHTLAYADAHDLGAITFGDYLIGLEQPRGAVEKFWSPIVVSACNLDVQRVAASEAVHVFQEGFLAHRDAAMMGVPTVPLVELYGAAERAIRDAGGEIRLGESVALVKADCVETARSERIDADAVVCAVPFERAVIIVSDRIQRSDPRFASMAKLRHSPILGVHLAFDRPALDLPHAALVGVGAQWLFGKDKAGTRVHAVISAADDWMALSEAQIVSRVVADVRACLPGARSAKLLSGRPVKEKRATFAPTPDSVMNRPATTGPSGLILAGDYVDTGWPATMEGAARSGSMAASAAMGEPIESALRPALKPGSCFRAGRAIAAMMG